MTVTRLCTWLTISVAISALESLVSRHPHCHGVIDWPWNPVENYLEQQQEHYPTESDSLLSLRFAHGAPPSS